MNSQDLWGNHSALWFPSPMPCADKQWRQCQPPFLQHWRQGWKCSGKGCCRKNCTLHKCCEEAGLTIFYDAGPAPAAKCMDFIWHVFSRNTLRTEPWEVAPLRSTTGTSVRQSSTRSFSQTNDFSASEVRSTSRFPMLQNCLEKQNTKFANYIISSYFKRFHCCMLFCKPLPFPKHRTKTNHFFGGFW